MTLYELNKWLDGDIKRVVQVCGAWDFKGQTVTVSLTPTSSKNKLLIVELEPNDSLRLP